MGFNSGFKGLKGPENEILAESRQSTGAIFHVD